MANVLRHRNPGAPLHLEVDSSRVLLRGAQEFRFVSAKTLRGQVDVEPDGRITATALE